MKLSLNLASKRYLNRRALNLGFGLVALILVIVLILQAQGYLRDRRLMATYQAHLGDLRTQLRGKLPERMNPETLTEQSIAYEQAKSLLKRDAFQWTVLFDRMESLLPEGVILTSFNPDYAENSLKINGIARDLARLQELIDRLYDDDFTQVYLNNQAEASIEDERGNKRRVLSFSFSLRGGF